MSWGPLEAVSDRLGGGLGVLGRSWGVLKRLEGILEASWTRLDALLRASSAPALNLGKARKQKNLDFLLEFS